MRKPSIEEIKLLLVLKKTILIKNNLNNLLNSFHFIRIACGI